MTKYVCLKFITGNDIVAVVDSECDESISVTGPIEVKYDYDEYGNFGLKFFPFLSYSDQELFTFSRKHVIFQSGVHPDTIAYYKTYTKARVEQEEEEKEKLLFNYKSTLIH